MGRHDLGTRFDVAAVEQGVAEGLGWGSAKAGVFLWELTRCTRSKHGLRVFSLLPLAAAHATDGSKMRARVYASVKGKTKSGWSLILSWCAGFL